MPAARARTERPSPAVCRVMAGRAPAGAVDGPTTRGGERVGRNRAGGVGLAGGGNPTLPLRSPVGGTLLGPGDLEGLDGGAAGDG
ncbi:hypothetical protein Shyd_42330 [Streptomyces hydrogenans]|uniref:Uncharacterized protein n=1 Tax=Streptomyces hydrogenans TaxID=1873719 RepID=A0ABQ3PCX3_9ACTN|nr:hypothetical protein Shyd_42330 [Streptomyces hydrogenans]